MDRARAQPRRRDATGVCALHCCFRQQLDLKRLARAQRYRYGAFTRSRRVRFARPHGKQRIRRILAGYEAKTLSPQLTKVHAASAVKKSAGGNRPPTKKNRTWLGLRVFL